MSETLKAAATIGHAVDYLHYAGDQWQQGEKEAATIEAMELLTSRMLLLLASPASGPQIAAYAVREEL